MAQYPQFMQLLGVGFVWISLHCAEMCGPIVLGLDLGDSMAYREWDSLRKIDKFRHSAKHITAYQVGRSITYAIIGTAGGTAVLVLAGRGFDFRREVGLAERGLVVGCLRDDPAGLHLLEDVVLAECFGVAVADDFHEHGVDGPAPRAAEFALPPHRQPAQLAGASCPRFCKIAYES